MALTVTLIATLTLAAQAYRISRDQRRQAIYRRLWPHVQIFARERNLGHDSAIRLSREWTDVRLPVHRKTLLIKAGFHPAAAHSPHTRMLDDEQLALLSERPARF